MPRRFAWQAWHLATSTFVWRGRRGAWRHPPSFRVAGVALVALGWLWWRAWAPLVSRDAAALCVAGVALGDIHFRLACTFVSRGRRGTCRHPPSFCGAGLATSTFVSRGRRGTCRHLPSFRVAGVALAHIRLRLAWQAWHLATSTFEAGVALGHIDQRYVCLTFARVAAMFGHVLLAHSVWLY